MGINNVVVAVLLVISIQNVPATDTPIMTKELSRQVWRVVLR